MSFTFTRVTVDVITFTLSTEATGATGAKVALLPKRHNPNGSTVWTTVLSYDAPTRTATARLVAPDADHTGATLALPEYDSDLWALPTGIPDVEPEKVTRIYLLGGTGVGNAAPGIPYEPRINRTGATTGQVPVLQADSTLAFGTVAGGGGGSDATTSAKGIVQLAGDLAGTAAAPTVPGLAGKLTAASNLSDVASAATARTNLGLGTAATQATGAFDASGAATAAQAAAVQRANHTGTQSADTITDGTTNKAYTATEKTKLAGVATGATANSTDATLLARANHTGTQSADTLTDGTTNKAFLAAERTKLTGIATGATANATDAQLRDRTTHTGTQAASTVTGLAVAVALTPTATKTATYTAAVGDLAMMNVPGGGATLNLPAAPADKSQVGYRAIGATTGTPLTINRGGSDTIGTAGATTVTIPLADEVAVLQYDSANTRWLGVSNVKTQASLDARYEAAGNALLKSANLSDLASATTARTNLGLGTAAVVNTGTASGNVPLLSTGGLLPIARIASGTPDGTKYVRDDGTLAVPAGGGSYTDEQVRDVMGTALVAGSNVTITVDDPGDTITVAAVNPRPPLLAATGRFYAGGLTASATAVVTASSRYYISPFWCHTAITIDQLVIEVTTAAAGVTTTIGYYPNQSGNTPVGATLQSLGTIDTTTIGLVALTLGTALSLPAGWSHFGAALTAAPRFRGNSMDDTLPAVYNNNNLAAGGLTANSYAGLWTTGTLPTTVPSGLSVGTGFRFAARISSVP